MHMKMSVKVTHAHENERKSDTSFITSDDQGWHQTSMKQNMVHLKYFFILWKQRY